MATTQSSKPQSSNETLVEQLDAWTGLRQDLMDNPQPFFQRLLEEAPVLLHGPFAYLSRFSDVERMSRDYETFSAKTSMDIDALVPPHLSAEEADLFKQVFGYFGLWMTNFDPPEHMRLRGLVQMAFTPRRVAMMQERIQSITEDLIDRLREQTTIEVVNDYALPLPMNVICAMLGVPESDWGKIHDWSATLASFMGADFSILREAATSIDEFTAYVGNMVSERRSVDPSTDLVAALVQAEDQGDRLNREEVVAMVILLAFAGHETTAGLVSNGLYHLLTHPEQIALLRQDWSLMPQAIDELLRYDTNVQYGTRFATRDVELSGVLIPAGSVVRGVYAAANRDPLKFSDPDALDIRRAEGRHLSFGIGPHYCLGHALAKMEATISIEMFLRTFPDARIAEPVSWRPNIQLRRVNSLRLEVA